MEEYIELLLDEEESVKLAAFRNALDIVDILDDGEWSYCHLPSQN
jgi:hypothetical protein